MNTIKRIAWIFVVILILVSAAGRSARAAETAEVPQTIQTDAGSLLVESESAGSFRYEAGERKLYIYGGTVSIRLNPAVDYSRDRIEVSGYATLVLSVVRILANRFAIFIDESAEAVRPFAKRSKESVLGLGSDVIEARGREDAVTFVHQAFLAIVVGIDIAVGFLPNLVALRILAASIIGEFGDRLIDDLVDEFAVVGEEVLDAVVLGGDKPLRPIDINRLVGAEEDSVQGIVIDDTLVVKTGVVEALLVLVFDHGIDRLQHPLGSGVDESDLVVIDIDDEFVAVVE